MKILLRLYGVVLFSLLVITPATANLSGTDVLLNSPNIIDDESGNPYITYSNGFAIDHDLMVWGTFRLKQTPPNNFSNTLWMMNLTDGKTQPLATSPSYEHKHQFDPPFSIADGWIVWLEDYNVNSYNAVSQKSYALTTDGAHVDLNIQRENRDPSISADRVVWAKKKHYTSTDYGIALYNLTSYTLQEIPTGPGKKSTPAIDGSHIVWSDERNEPGGGDIYLFDLDRNEEIPLCTARDLQHYPRISGEYVVWEDLRDGNPAIYLYNLTSKTEQRISGDNPLTLASMPYIAGNYVAWTQYDVHDRTREKSRTIAIYRINTGERELFLQGTRPLTLLDLKENRLLYYRSEGKSLQEGYVHLFVIDTMEESLATTQPAPVTGQENLTREATHQRSPAPSQSAPVCVAVPLAAVCIAFSIWSRTAYPSTGP